MRITSCCSSLDDYLDGDLSEDERSQWRDLSRSCSACTSEIEAQQRIDQALQRAWSLVERPQTNVVLTESSGDPTAGTTTKLLAIVATLAVSVCVASLLIQPERPNPKPRESPSMVRNTVDHDVPHRATPKPTGQNLADQIAADQNTLDQSTVDQSVRKEQSAHVTSRQDIVVSISRTPEFTFVRYVPALYSRNQADQTKPSSN